MPKFLTGCHYNEEEISRHLKKNTGYWTIQIYGNKFATGEILKKIGRSCEGADFSWLSSKVSRTLVWGILVYGQMVVHVQPSWTLGLSFALKYVTMIASPFLSNAFLRNFHDNILRSIPSDANMQYPFDLILNVFSHTTLATSRHLVACNSPPFLCTTNTATDVAKMTDARFSSSLLIESSRQPKWMP